MRYVSHGWTEDAPEVTTSTMCLAVSQDGLRWEKPAIGLHEFGQSKETNILSIAGVTKEGLFTAAYEPDDPDRRWKAKRFVCVSISAISA